MELTINVPSRLPQGRGRQRLFTIKNLTHVSTLFKIDIIKAQIAALEAEHLRVRGVLSDTSVVRTCLTCRETNANRESDRAQARQYATLLDFLGTSRAAILQSASSVNAASANTSRQPAMVAMSAEMTAIVRAIDDFDSPTWRALRFVWLERNTAVPACG